MELSLTERIEAEKNGISYHTLIMRLRRGWDKDRAISEPPNQRKKEVQHNLKIAEQNGIRKELYFLRVHGYGWDEERAMTQKVKGK